MQGGLTPMRIDPYNPPPLSGQIFVSHWRDSSWASMAAPRARARRNVPAPTLIPRNNLLAAASPRRASRLPPVQLSHRCSRSPRARRCRRARLAAALGWAIVGTWLMFAAPAARGQEIRAATASSQEPITVAADWCTRWQEGVYDV